MRGRGRHSNLPVFLLACRVWFSSFRFADATQNPGGVRNERQARTPASFSHPLLVAQKVVPQPAAEPQADAPPAPKSDKASEADAPIKPATLQADLELRSTVGHADGAKPTIGEPRASTSLRERTHTADASAGMPATQPAATITDAASSGGNATPPEELRSDGAPASTAGAANPQTATSEAELVAAKPAETASSDDTPAETKPSEADVSATGSTITAENPAEKKLEAKADDVKIDSPKPDVPQSNEKQADKPGDAVKAATGIGPIAPDPKKDQTRLPDTAKPAAAKTDTATAPKRTGQIAVFISRKDSKLYVRQNFAPLFDAHVTIAPSDQPLGTHVFTAEIDKDESTQQTLPWGGISAQSHGWNPPERRAASQIVKGKAICDSPA